MNVTILRSCAYFRAGQDVSVSEALGEDLIRFGFAELTAATPKPEEVSEPLADTPPENKAVKRSKVSRKRKQGE